MKYLRLRLARRLGLLAPALRLEQRVEAWVAEPEPRVDRLTMLEPAPRRPS